MFLGRKQSNSKKVKEISATFTSDGFGGIFYPNIELHFFFFCYKIIVYFMHLILCSGLGEFTNIKIICYQHYSNYVVNGLNINEYTYV